jgi:hypothetical protein
MLGLPIETGRHVAEVRFPIDLPLPADRIWELLLEPATMAHVLRGLIGFPSMADRPGPLRAGDEGTGWLRLGHVVPFTRWTIQVVQVDPARRTIRTNEHGWPLRRWDHTLEVEPAAAGCRYTDGLVLDAGVLTPVATRVAALIFRYRHRRWRALALRLASASPA